MSDPIATSQPAQVPDAFQGAVHAAEAVTKALNGEFVERSQEIRSLLTALIAGEHVLLLGPPGVAKSGLVNSLCSALGGTHFSILLTKFTVPEEMFGPISLKGLENDEYRRVTKGYLPEADIVFADEIFKANSSILNSMLTALNEGQFDNGGKRSDIPLKLCVGASNEFPQDDGLQALYDRFVLRHWVEPIKSPQALRGLLANAAEPAINTSLTQQQLEALRTARDMVQVPEDVLDGIMDIRDELSREHGINCSDRRWRKCMKLIRSHAVLHGRLTADRTDLIALSSALWNEQDDIPIVYGLVARNVNPDLGKALELLDAATQQFERVDLKAEGTTTETLARCNEELKQIGERMKDLSAGDEIDEAARKVVAMQQEVAKTVARKLGLGDLGF